MMQSPANNTIARRRAPVALAIAATTASPESTCAGRVAYIGKPFTQWPDIRRCLIDRDLDVQELGDSREAISAEAFAFANLVIVGESDGARDTHEVCAEVRRLSHHIPILLLTKADDAVGRILGLENGADAWAAADADARSSVAQIRALLRREIAEAAAAKPDHESSTLRAGTFAMNAASREVAVGQQRVELTTMEFELLWNLLKHAGQVVSRLRLAQLIGYGPDMLEGRAIDSLVGRLRHRLGATHARQIRSIRAVGYMLCTDTLFEQADDEHTSNH